MKIITTFPSAEDFRKAKTVIDTLHLPHEIISPEPGYARVGFPALVMEHEAYGRLIAESKGSFMCSGWVDYHPAKISVPDEAPRIFENDIFGDCFVMVHVPCVADMTKIRIIAHLTGSLLPVMPYMNTEYRKMSFNRNAGVLTYNEQGRMIALYDRKVSVAKADEIIDAWRMLEDIRCMVNSVWERRNEITPSNEMRIKPPAIEIYTRLPKTNCRLCGEMTCLSFAMKLWQGDGNPAECKPVFEGEYGNLKDALIEICRGLGIEEQKSSE